MSIKIHKLSVEQSRDSRRLWEIGTDVYRCEPTGRGALKGEFHIETLRPTEKERALINVLLHTLGELAKYHEQLVGSEKEEAT